MNRFESNTFSAEKRIMPKGCGMEAAAPAIGGTASVQPEPKLMKDLQRTAPKFPLFSGLLWDH